MGTKTSKINIDEQREILKKAYIDKKWAAKVDAMLDNEVSAVFLRLKEQGKI